MARKIWSMVLLLCVLLCSVACGDDSGQETLPQDTGITTEPTTDRPQADSPTEGQETENTPVEGTLITEPLKVTEDFSRCAQTTANTFSEIPGGFYLCFRGMLYFADRSNPYNWVPVCNKADCPHTMVDTNGGCNALADQVLITEDRIYKTLMADPQYRFALLSTALDGTDLRTEFVFTEAQELMGLNAGTAEMVITHGYLVAFMSALNEEGTYDFRVYTASEDGVTLQMDEQREGMSIIIDNYPSHQDLWFWGAALADNPTRRVLYTLEDNQLVSLDLTGLITTGSHFTGDTLMTFRSNDGYYRTDTETWEEVKLAEPQLEDSNAAIPLPNCILESHLFSKSRTSGQQALLLFDGESWRKVAVPEEFLQPESALTLSTSVAVASDRILLQAYDRSKSTMESCSLYQILLTTDTPVLEHLADIG